MAKSVKKEEPGYVGARISSRQMKRYMARHVGVATNPPKGTKIGERHGPRAAIVDLVVNAPLEYVAPNPVVKSATDKIEQALKRSDRRK